MKKKRKAQKQPLLLGVGTTRPSAEESSDAGASNRSIPGVGGAAGGAASHDFAGARRGARMGTEQPDRESRESGIVSPERNRLVEQHFRQHPEGDPAVRRKSPDRGEIPITERHGGTMTVRQPRRKGGKAA